VIFIISLESYFELAPWKSLPNIIIGILFLGHFALQACALILLFQKESSEWFERLSSIAPPSESDFSMPIRVKTAVTLLYITFVISLYSQAIMIVAFILGVGELKLDFQPKSSLGLSVSAHNGFIITTILIRDALHFFLIYLTGKGKNWARILILVSFIIGIPKLVWSLPQAIAEKPISLISTVPLLALYVVALVYLFQKESTDWFKKRKIADQQSYQQRLMTRP
jgi:hypothetical protein